MERFSVDSNIDHYTASIEFSNACREFYMNRIKATDNLKQKIQSSENDQTKLNSSKPKSSIQSAMDTLRKEMASLMDQDLSLMKQLLTLNETIEDIKNRRMYGISKDSLSKDSMDKLSVSDWSVSETDLYSSQEDLNETKTAESSNFLTVPAHYKNRFSSTSCSTKKNLKPTEITVLVPNDNCFLESKNVKVIHGVQSSIDSGYDETDFYQSDIEASL